MKLLCSREKFINATFKHLAVDRASSAAALADAQAAYQASSLRVYA
jgi:hypothetical protein